MVKGTTQVILEFNCNSTKGNNNFKIIRELNPSSLKVFKDGRDKTRDSIPNTTTYILEVLSTSQEVFKNCIAMQANNTVPFMSQGKTDKKKFIESLFNLDVVTQMFKLVKDDINISKRELDIESKLVEQINSNIFDYTSKQRKELERIANQKQKKELEKQIIEKDIHKISLKISKLKEEEARLSKISNELLADLDKNTVKFAPNFDDRLLEPTVLPAKYPNLLVNGTMGISAGYATNIPPHNLGEVIDATIKRIESPNCYLDTILEIIKGPDFPTGGIACGIDGIKDAFKTGKGRVVVRSKYDIVKEKGKVKIVITEIPYDVNKAMLVNKIDGIRIDKKIDGMAEVRDESDREGLRIVIDLKAGANPDLILGYLFKNTDLQISYNYNMVAIVNRVPKTLGILEILDAYIAHQKEVIIKRSEFDLATYEKRMHIVEGLIKCLSILDEVIKVIRASKNKADAKNNLVDKFKFTIEQSEAIVTLQLYKLTNTDVLELEEEMNRLFKLIEGLKAILSDEEALKYVMKKELKLIKKEYETPRKTKIEEAIKEIKLDAKEMIPKENVVIVVTNEGYVKRVSSKSYAASTEDTTLKPGDFITGLYECTTLDTLVIFTNMGNYLYIPVYKIPDVKWKELGKHVNNIIMLSTGEEVISSFIYNKEDTYILASKEGMIKRTLAKDFEVARCSKPMIAMRLKENDLLVDVKKDLGNIVLATENGYYLNYNSEEVPLVGPKASAVKGISLKDDIVKNMISFDHNSEYLTIFTDNKTAKRVKLTDLETHSRAKKGNLLLKKTKTVTYKILNVLLTSSRDLILTKADSDINIFKNSDIARKLSGFLHKKQSGPCMYSKFIFDDIGK